MSLEFLFCPRFCSLSVMVTISHNLFNEKMIFMKLVGIDIGKNKYFLSIMDKDTS